MYLEIFITFFKIGLFTFGGGYAMIPLIQKEIVDNKKWIEDSDLLDIVAIAESTPGPIAINAATFIGYSVNGFIGSVFATIGVVLPSFMIIVGVFLLMTQIQDNKYIEYAFYGIRAGVLALIVNACIRMYKKADHHLFSYSLMILSFVCVVVFKINVVYVIGICALLGLVRGYIK